MVSNPSLQKWTGSTTLSGRFHDHILSDPKSFTRRDFSILQTRYDEISSTIHASAPTLSEPSSPDTLFNHSNTEQPRSSPTKPGQEFAPLPPPQMVERVKYWNEYDYGSDCGRSEEGYAIYINPEDNSSFPGLSYLTGIFKVPVQKARKWFKMEESPERAALLGPQTSFGGYSSTAIASESDEEGYASSEGYPATGYATHYALPSLNEQAAHRYRETVLFWGTIGCFITSLILLAVAGILISTGRHKLRVEVDAGVTVGVVASLFSACTGLGMTLYRRDDLSFLSRLSVWSTFVATCLLNGMLLVLVVGNSP